MRTFTLLRRCVCESQYNDLANLPPFPSHPLQRLGNKSDKALTNPVSLGCACCAALYVGSGSKKEATRREHSTGSQAALEPAYHLCGL